MVCRLSQLGGSAAYAATDAEKFLDQTNGSGKVKVVWLDLSEGGQTMFDVQVDMVRMGWHP